ncbi:YgaP family membrane protein [Thiolapillus sp.]
MQRNGCPSAGRRHQNRLWFTAFVGANLFQSAFTGFCPLAMILKKLGAKPAGVF